MVDSTAARLLPQNSTPLERALAVSVQPPWLDAMAGLPAGVKFLRPAGFAPWVAAEWWLADFAQYFDDAEALIEAGLPWLQMRGTAAAVRAALSWIGFDNARLEQEGAILQIDPGNYVAQFHLDAIRHLVEASIPKHVWFRRLYHGYDIRPLGIDREAKWDAGLWDTDSGVWVDGVKLSFGGTLGFFAGCDDPGAYLGIEHVLWARADLDDAPRWDVARYDECREPATNIINIEHVIGIENADGADWLASEYPCTGGWDGRAANGNVTYGITEE